MKIEEETDDILTTRINKDSSNNNSSVTLSNLTSSYISIIDVDQTSIRKIGEQLFQKCVFQSISRGDSDFSKLASKGVTSTEKRYSVK